MVQFLIFSLAVTGSSRECWFRHKFIGDGILAFFMTGENPFGDALRHPRDSVPRPRVYRICPRGFGEIHRRLGGQGRYRGYTTARS